MNMVLENKLKKRQIQKGTFPCFFTWKWAKQISNSNLVGWNAMKP
jgi:hypothetical protein